MYDKRYEPKIGITTSTMQDDVKDTPQTIESKSEEILKFLTDFKDELESFLQMPKPEMKSPTPEPPLRNPIEAIANNLDCARGLAGDIRGIVFGQTLSRLRS